MDALRLIATPLKRTVQRADGLGPPDSRTRDGRHPRFLRLLAFILPQTYRHLLTLIHLQALAPRRLLSSSRRSSLNGRRICGHPSRRLHGLWHILAAAKVYLAHFCEDAARDYSLVRWAVLGRCVRERQAWGDPLTCVECDTPTRSIDGFCFPLCAG